MAQHHWVPSTLGHGNRMCAACGITDLEAEAIGQQRCDAPKPPAAALPEGHSAQIIPFPKKDKDNG
jgi:hypothetical protein